MMVNAEIWLTEMWRRNSLCRTSGISTCPASLSGRHRSDHGSGWTNLWSCL